MPTYTIASATRSLIIDRKFLVSLLSMRFDANTVDLALMSLNAGNMFKAELDGFTLTIKQNS